MYFFNARLKFKIPDTHVPVPGSVIAASAIAPVDLEKRAKDKKPYAHVKRKFLDPQLYMATVDPALDDKTVARLAAYPWFHGSSVPKYSSGEHGTRKKWKAANKPSLVGQWTRTVPTDPSEIQKAARAAVEFQMKIGCEVVLLAVPLTTIADQTLEPELAWLDAGIAACKELKIETPIFATVALSEPLLHVPALKNPIIHLFSNHIASRSEIAGAYIVLEQTDASEYFWNSKDPLMALAVLIDDLHRGANKRVAVNYVGTFGLVARAIGAEIWSSGYFLNQRRFSLKGKMGIAHPRYHSLALAGDIGLKTDIAAIRDAGLVDKVMTGTNADAGLRTALKAGKTPGDVPEWKYAPNNCTAAQKHYLEIAAGYGASLDALSQKDRVAWVDSWLNTAAELAGELEKMRLVTPSSEIRHQKVWRDVFQDWRSYAKQ